MILENIGNEKFERIIEQCEAHEGFLKELLRGRYACLQNYLGEGLQFGFARRWNSWYPSYFDVEGGCYVLIPGDLDPQDEHNLKDDRIGVIVIDPGYKFIDILRNTYQIEPQDIRTIIVTHFHPDHMAGLLEYATIMNTSKQACNIYLNETAFVSFKSLQNSFITVNELQDAQIQEIMRYTTIDNKKVIITVKAINVHHNELGNQHRSLGLILETKTFPQENNMNEKEKFRIGIIGDTDGNEQYIPSYIENFHQVDILVLHLGTFSNKKFGRGGKHLYIDGVRQILKKMEERWVNVNHEGEKIIVLSEFGLELADDDTLYRKLRPFIESHSWRLPIIFASHYLSEKQYLHGEISESRDGSNLFAKAILGFISNFSLHRDIGSITPREIINRNEVDEFIIAFGIQIISLINTNQNIDSSIIEFCEFLLSKISKERKEKYVDGLTVENYLFFLDQKIKSNELLIQVKSYFDLMVKKASFSSSPLPVALLVDACDILISRLSKNLENPGNVIFYIDKLRYIINFAESRGLCKSDEYFYAIKKFWLHSGQKGNNSLEYLWTISLIGIYLLMQNPEQIAQ